jgi:predicted CoA-binding protein
VFLKQGARVTPITPIADTSTATTEQVAVKLNEVAAKLNELIAVLRNAQHLEA